MASTSPPERLRAWIEARNRFQLSHAHVQMARELGLKTDKLGKLDNHHHELWKAPLSEFIEELYLKGFGRRRPDEIVSLEERARLDVQKEAARREARRIKLEQES